MPAKPRSTQPTETTVDDTPEETTAAPVVLGSVGVPRQAVSDEHIAHLEHAQANAIGDHAEALAAQIRSLKHNGVVTDAEAIRAEGPRNEIEAAKAAGPDTTPEQIAAARHGRFAAVTDRDHA